jgi:hypothetical protein
MGHFEAKILMFKCPKCVFLASTSVPFRLATMQMPNLALIETRRITVHPLDRQKISTVVPFFSLFLVDTHSSVLPNNE